MAKRNSYSFNNPYNVRPDRTRRPVVITLSCGHAVRMRDTPMNPDMTYVCRTGTGCGYNLRWVRWRDEERDMSRDNNGYGGTEGRKRKGDE